jgi:hypothetical protein
MSQTELPYKEVEERMKSQIQKHDRGYLATSKGDKVTVRQMGMVSDGLTIWFLTDEKSRKYAQMMKNPNIGIAAGLDLQIEGITSFKGHPLDEGNKDFLKIFREQLPERYEQSIRSGRILQREGTRLIEVTPNRIIVSIWRPQWDLETDFQPHLELLNVNKGKAYRIPSLDAYDAPAYRE